MEKLLQGIQAVNGVLNDFAWGPVMLLLLVGTGAWLTVRTRCIQVRRFGYILRNTVGTLFRPSGADHGENLSPFQAVSTALAGTVGTGNIAGVTGAIFIGGPGAVFWMWVSAFLGMCTKYAEIALAIRFRNKDENGVHYGGPMYYIENGLGKNWKWLAVLFSILGVLASFGIGNIAQGSEIAGAVVSLSGTQSPAAVSLAVGLVLAAVVAVVVLGGVKRIGQVTSYLVPFMAAFYILAGLALIVLRIDQVPRAFADILSGAFSLRSVGGGAAGYGIMVAMRQGVARGVFSNEAGLGSAPIAHAASSTEEPAEQASGASLRCLWTPSSSAPSPLWWCCCRGWSWARLPWRPIPPTAPRRLRPSTPFFPATGAARCCRSACCFSPFPPSSAGATTAAAAWGISAATTVWWICSTSSFSLRSAWWAPPAPAA